MNTSEPSRQPSPDPAERDAFFPSPYSLSQFTSATTDLSGADYPDARRDGRWKVLMIAADERYLPTANGHLFSTGNHPVETLLPMYHLHKAGFGIDVATLSGNPVKFEWWGVPTRRPRDRRPVRTLRIPLPPASAPGRRGGRARCRFGLCRGVHSRRSRCVDRPAGKPRGEGHPAVGGGQSTSHHHPLSRPCRAAGGRRG